ncbi:MAG: hypothetical protein IJ191_03895 [Treponema sp.]|nr:hypothetical protein [Treponema sp.]
MKPVLVVLAAGMGSRYGGVKQIDAVGVHDECLLDYATYDAQKCGFSSVLYIIRKDIEADFRERLFDRVARNFDARYVFQAPDSLLTAEQYAAATARTKPWGTLHALLCAEPAIAAPFAVINADDYYGRSAIETIGAHLAAQDTGSTEHGMVGYVLGNTMSASGAVTRGICTVKDGVLSSIVETGGIRFDGEKIVCGDDGATELTGKEWVSMNLFGFTCAAFESFHNTWDRFIAHNAASEKAEALLPAATGELIADGSGTVHFFTSTEKWFGMTYADDRANVKKEIARMTAAGYYPEQLWEK